MKSSFSRHVWLFLGLATLCTAVTTPLDKATPPGQTSLRWGKATIALGIIAIRYIYAHKHKQVPALQEQDLNNVLDSHKEELQKLLQEYIRKGLEYSRGGLVPHGENVCKKDWLPGYYIKHGVERFYNAQRLGNVIRDNNLDLMAPPQKVLYHVRGDPKDISSENFLIIAKEVHDGGQQLTIKQAEQLRICEQKAEYTDLHSGNYVINEKGKVVIIDTDFFAMNNNRPDLIRQQNLIEERRKLLLKRRELLFKRRFPIFSYIRNALRN